MIKMPADLTETAKLVGYTPLAIDEDKLHSLSKSWGAVEKIFQQEANAPMETPGTVWDPTTSWVRGNDRPLDAFVEFYDNYPRNHYYSIAAQAPAVAGALNNIAGIVINHKRAAYKALQSAKDQLSRGGHMLGGAYHTVLFFHIKGESESDGDADSATIVAAMGYLRKLNQQTQISINEQASILAQATKALDRVSDHATKTMNALPGGSAYTAVPPFGYDDWASIVHAPR
jgi:hypothetical protein